MAKNVYNMVGIKIICIGLAILAFIYEESYISGIFGTLPKITVGFVVASLLGWLIILIGSMLIFKYRREFRIAFILSLCGGLFTLLQLYTMYGFYNGGNLMAAFISGKYLLIKFLTEVSMLGIYVFTIGGGTQLMAKMGDIRRAKVIKAKGSIGTLVILATMIVISFGYIFQDKTGYLIVSAGVGIGILAHLIMILGISKINTVVNKKRI